MKKTIEFYFDFGSPTAYLAHTQMKRFQRDYDVTIQYKPMLLGGVLKATGNRPPGAVPAKGQYMLAHDLPRFVKRYQVPFKMNPFFPINTLTIMRGCYAAIDLGCFETYVDTLFNAMWVEEKNLGTPNELVAVLRDAKIDAEKFLELIGTDSVKDSLKLETQRAVDRGVFGAPTLFVGNNMYFGQDRLDFIEEEIQLSI